MSSGKWGIVVWQMGHNPLKNGTLSSGNLNIILCGKRNLENGKQQVPGDISGCKNQLLTVEKYFCKIEFVPFKYIDIEM